MPQSLCGVCLGTGRYSSHDCMACQGTGRISGGGEARSGHYGRPKPAEQDVHLNDVPAEVRATAQAYARSERLDEDWTMVAGWLVMRQWVDHGAFTVCVARVVYETDLCEVEG